MLFAFAIPAMSQCAMKHDGFSAGEKITFDLSFNWKFIWTKAGEATLTFAKSTYNEEPAYRIDLIAAGNKTADTFYKLRDTLTSYVSERMEPLYYRKGAIEGKRYWVDQAYFSYEDGVSHVKQIRTRDGEVTEYENSDSRCIYDLLSVIIWARFMDIDDLTKGTRIQAPVATGRRVQEQTLIYHGKEIFQAESGIKYNSLKFSLVEKDKDGKDKDVIVFNITDDLNRIPIRLDLFLKFGAAKASAMDISGNSYPFTSIIKE